MNEIYAFVQGVDMWSLGVFAYMMMCGYAPFRGDTREEVSVYAQISLRAPKLSPADLKYLFDSTLVFTDHSSLEKLVLLPQNINCVFCSIARADHCAGFSSNYVWKIYQIEPMESSRTTG